MTHIKRTTTFFILVFLLYPIPGNAAECPEGATKIREEIAGGKVRIYCKCLPGHMLIDNKCLKLSPVNDQELDARTGKAFKLGQKLRDYATHASNWSIKARATLMRGIVEAERGMYGRAVYLLKQIEEDIPGVPIIREGLDHANYLINIQTARTKAGPLAQEIIQPEDLSQLPLKARVKVFTAAVSANAGDYLDAIRLLQEALKEAPNEPSIRGALTYVADLKAAEDLLIDIALNKSSDQAPDRFADARRRAKQNAASRLGWHLVEKEDYPGAVRYFKEVLKSEEGDTAYKWTMQECIKNVQQLKPTPIPGFPIYPSKADVILDALEYGNGNWEESLRYLEVAYRADPGNLHVRDARNYLQGLYGGLQLGTQR